MAWFERPSTAYERTTFARLRQVYLLMKRWKENFNELDFAPLPFLEHEELDDALRAETSQELIRSAKLSLRETLARWEKFFADGTRRNSPAWGRVLRHTEEEAVRYTSAQWKEPGQELFSSIPEVFAAYRETPFATLYRGSLLLISSRPTQVEFYLHHPAVAMEEAWMRGFTAVLRPEIQVQTRESDQGMKIFQWIG